MLGGFASRDRYLVLTIVGDKDNHVASLHIPQMLYIWPCMVFFFWPVLLPQLADVASLKKRLPRPTFAIGAMVLMACAVHFNTVVHPFTLADNRHYTFYVFRLLRRHWTIKYIAVPIYYACAWLVYTALGSNANTTTNDPVKVSFALVWLASTALSLVSAPLVEPRYFIIPWLLWRMHVPESTAKSESTPVREANKDKDAKAKAAGAFSKTLRLMAVCSLWIELAWYLAINYGTCWMFLHRGFAWPQEPGNVQRFMW